MSKLDRLLTASSIIGTLSTVYDQYAARKRNRDVEDRDRKIRELEERIARLEAK